MLAEHFHSSKRQLCAKFKKKMDTSIVNYFFDLKISQAKLLFREESISVNSIYKRLGFKISQSFQNAPKQRGHSPRPFRRILISDLNLRNK